MLSYSEFLELTQGLDSVDCYIEKVLKCGRKLKKSDTELMDKIVHGLSKEIKNFVVMKEAKTLEQVTKYARMGQSLVNGECSKVFSVIKGQKEQSRDFASVSDSHRSHYSQRRPMPAGGQCQHHRQDRRQRRPFQENCEHCGRCTHISSACKFKNAKCYQCHQYGHLARMHRPYYKK